MSKRLLALFAALIVVLTACSNGSSVGESASDAAPAVLAEEAGNAANGGGIDAPDAETELVVAKQPTSRQIILNGTLVLEVDNVTEATDAAIDQVLAAGGFLAGENTNLQSQRPSAELTFKVPPERFTPLLRDLRELGLVLSQSSTTEDVTERIVDIESRIATAETSVDRLRGFLEKATTVTDITDLERELSAREAELESLRAQLRSLRDLVSLSTITLVLDAEPPAPEITGGDVEEAGLPGFMSGLRAGWDVLVDFGSLIATLAGFALPFLPLLIAAGGFLWWLRRRSADAGPGMVAEA